MTRKHRRLPDVPFRREPESGVLTPGAQPHGPPYGDKIAAGKDAAVCVVTLRRHSGAPKANPESRDSGFDASHRPGMTTERKTTCVEAAKLSLSFRDGPKGQTRNLEILRCAIAHHSSMLAHRPGMTAVGCADNENKMKRGDIHD